MIKELLLDFGPPSITEGGPSSVVLAESFAYLLSSIESKRQERSQKHILSKKYYDYYLTAKSVKKKLSVVNFAGTDIEVDEWETFRPAEFDDTIAGKKEYFPLGTKADPLSRQTYKISITSENSFKNGTAQRYYIRCNCPDFKHVFSKIMIEKKYCLPMDNEDMSDEPSPEAIEAGKEKFGICKHIYAIMKQPQYAKYLGDGSDPGPLIQKRPKPVKKLPEPVYEPSEQDEYGEPSEPYEEPYEEPLSQESLLKQRAKDHIKKNLEQIITALNNAYGRGDRDLYIRYSGSKTQYKKYLFTVSLINLDKNYLKYPAVNYNGKINVISYSSQKLESKYKGTVKIPSMNYAGKSYGALDLYSLFSPLELIDIIKEIKTHSEMPQTLQQQLSASNIVITESIFEDLTLDGIEFNFLIEDIIREYNGNYKR